MQPWSSVRLRPKLCNGFRRDQLFGRFQPSCDSNGERPPLRRSNRTHKLPKATPRLEHTTPQPLRTTQRMNATRPHRLPWYSMSSGPCCMALHCTMSVCQASSSNTMLACTPTVTGASAGCGST